MDLEPDPGLKLTPNHHHHNVLRRDIDRTRAGARVDPKFRSNRTTPNMDLEPDLDPKVTPTSIDLTLVLIW